MNDQKLKKIVDIGSFGICPRCSRLLMLFQAKYTLYGLTESGRYPNRILKTEENLTAVCKCGFRTKMANTIEGTVPAEYYKLKLYKKQLEEEPNQSIGYKETNNKEN